MNEQEFRSLMTRADAYARYVEPERSDYWTGYRRGLRRRYHGENFGTDDEHTLWLSLDGDRAALGQGYRNGFQGTEGRHEN